MPVKPTCNEQRLVHAEFRRKARDAEPRAAGVAHHPLQQVAARLCRGGRQRLAVEELVVQRRRLCIRLLAERRQSRLQVARPGRLRIPRLAVEEPARRGRVEHVAGQSQRPACNLLEFGARCRKARRHFLARHRVAIERRLVAHLFPRFQVVERRAEPHAFARCGHQHRPRSGAVAVIAVEPRGAAQRHCPPVALLAFSCTVRQEEDESVRNGWCGERGVDRLGVGRRQARLEVAQRAASDVVSPRDQRTGRPGALQAPVQRLAAALSVRRRKRRVEVEVGTLP